MSPIQISKGYEKKILKEICDVDGGFAFKSEDYKNDGIPLIRISNIQDGKIQFEENTVFLEKKFLGKYKKFLIKRGDILIALSGATTGKCGIYYLNKSAFLNQRVGRISLKIFEHNLQKYLFYFFKKSSNEIFRKSYGGAQPNISPKDIEKFEILIPDDKLLPKIVQKLDYIFGQLEEKSKTILELQKMKLKHSELLSDNFMSFLIAELIPTENYPSNWGSTTLGETFNQIKDKWVPNEKSENLNYIGLENIESNTGKLVKFTPTNSLDIKSSKTNFSKNDVLYGKLRPYLNKVLLPTFDGVCSTDILVLKPKSNISREFLAYFLRSYYVLSKMTKLMYGTKMPRAKIQDLQDVKIELPSKKERQQIVSKLEDSEKLVDRVKQSVNKITEQQEELTKNLQNLQNSILDKAFLGELMN